ncbi:MAG: RluA family pseudouridine synthase [Deltaproteobacteria bacterium]|nr:RluA family pseudouridine synthase [Deltaproteobacteria bacterium]
MEKTLRLTVESTEAGERLDVFIAARLRGFTRSRVKTLFDGSRVTVNGKAGKPGLRVKGADAVDVLVPPERIHTVEPEEVPLEILYEDSDIIAVNKPAGMTTHPGAGRTTGTLVNALLGHTKDLSLLGGPLRAGIVHRLDKDTTGAIVAAKNDSSHLALSKQFKEHTAGRTYLALVWGGVRDMEGVVDMPIGRDIAHRKKISPRARKKRTAVTRYRVLKRFPLLTLLELKLETGRTHQIRVHLNAINHPVVGDQTYGKRCVPPAMEKEAADLLKKIKRQCLHARTLTLTHPSTGKLMEFQAPLPEDFEEILKTLEGG